MKRRNYIFGALLTLFAVSFASTVEAQLPVYLDPRFGADADSASRMANAMTYNFYSDAYKNREYDKAIELFGQLADKAPRVSQNIYVYAINMYRVKIATSKSLAEKNANVDGLMKVYDKRMEAFGDHATRGRAYIITNKALDYLNYKPTDREGIRELFEQAIKENGNNIDPVALTSYFNALTTDFKNMMIESDEYLTAYDKVVVVLDSEPVTDAKANAKKTIESLFVGSGAADCANIEKLFRPRIEANPNDTVIMEKTMALLLRGNCKSDFVTEVGERYYKIKPSSDMAMMLASSFEEKKDLAKARQYLNEAIVVETDPVEKAKLAVRISGTELASGNARSAADFARQALDVDPENGFAYLLLAQSYGVGSNTLCNGFTRQTVAWLVVDLLSKARTLLENEEAQVKTIDELVATYRQHFPTKEECFFRNMNAGDGYKVSCGWINGQTTVRNIR